MNAAMGTNVLMNCRLGSPCYTRSPRRVPLAARLVALALAFGGGLLAASGEQWLLAEAPPAVNELTLATCVLDDVYGAARPAAACTSGNEQPERGHAL